MHRCVMVKVSILTRPFFRRNLIQIVGVCVCVCVHVHCMCMCMSCVYEAPKECSKCIFVYLLARVPLPNEFEKYCLTASDLCLRWHPLTRVSVCDSNCTIHTELGHYRTINHKTLYNAWWSCDTYVHNTLT